MGMENTITVKVENESYEKINYSAFSIAFCRTFTDIPYSQEIFDELNKIQKNNESKVSIPGRKIRMESSVVLRSEARYKLVNKLLVENGSKQVLEIASGLSPRGLTKDPDVNFVEIDLP